MGRDKCGGWGGYLKKDVKTLIKENGLCRGKEKNYQKAKMRKVMLKAKKEQKAIKSKTKDGSWSRGRAK